ncbi:hypothetical protein BTHERMOSOX_298 [Bathymodiolus thermophilus thioautotrophic gill symbiont]|nr:hypothetical protein BTHERMOSOX_298 [Bathymodiolus thermophilus thioautotrophic gill symbiont]
MTRFPLKGITLKLILMRKQSDSALLGDFIIINYFLLKLQY